jgi:CRP-like cAMP-binding protein
MSEKNSGNGVTSTVPAQALRRGASATKEMRGASEPEMSCEACPVGVASNVGRGGHCHFVRHEAHAGEQLYHQGDDAGAVWMVKRGRVLMQRAAQNEQDAAHAHAVRQRGDFIGLEALVLPRYADTATALQDVVVCGARRDHIDKWLGAPATPARAALEQTLRSMCADPPRAASSDGTAVRRLARWLVAEVKDGRAPAVPKRMLADLLGMVPETLSRALAELRKTGAIGATRQRRIQIIDENALRSAAGL